MALTSSPKASGPVHKWQPARVSEKPGLSSCPSGTTEGGNGKQVATTAVLSHGAGAGHGQAGLAVGRSAGMEWGQQEQLEPAGPLCWAWYQSFPDNNGCGSLSPSKSHITSVG